MLAATPPKRIRAANLKAVGEDLVREFRKMLRDLAEEKYSNPVITVVATMPKEELALLAEALINLTALKRKTTAEAETVGGPTDVAVISKGDGFIWIKRKHYFDPNFNPGFCATYIEERDDD